METRVAAVREFNRFYTSRIGALREGLLETPYSLTEARVIFELGQADVTEVSALRGSLELDAGYLSRILRRFESDGLVSRARSPADGRRQVVRLTTRGRSTFRLLDKRSFEETAKVLARLTEEEQRRLVASMDVIRGVLGRMPQPSHVTLRTPRAGDYGWVVQRHGALYAEEYGWDESFEALVARVVSDYVEQHDPAAESAWIAEADGERAGCVFCVRKDERTAQLRLLLVEPTARGAGVGSRLVDECLAFARRAGYERITLWTNDVLDSARRIYERAGFELVEEERHRSFGADLVGQTWERAL